jgi:DNA-binding LacI/PurR family transcriptional regulator
MDHMDLLVKLSEKYETQKELAICLGVCAYTVSRWLSGKKKMTDESKEKVESLAIENNMI